MAVVVVVVVVVVKKRRAWGERVGKINVGGGGCLTDGWASMSRRFRLAEKEGRNEFRGSSSR